MKRKIPERQKKKEKGAPVFKGREK